LTASTVALVLSRHDDDRDAKSSRKQKVTKKTKTSRRNYLKHEFVAFVFPAFNSRSKEFGYLRFLLLVNSFFALTLALVLPRHDDDGNAEKQELKRSEQSRGQVGEVSNLCGKREQRLAAMEGGEEESEQDNRGDEAGDGKDLDAKIFSPAIASKAVDPAKQHQQKIERLHERRR
jgi:hypothetical protein